jgi:hypothetical protein
MVALTYSYKCVVDERQSDGGGGMERTGRTFGTVIERTIVVPKGMVDAFFEIDWQQRQRVSKNAVLVEGVEKRDISLTYPAPHYWG